MYNKLEKWFFSLLDIFSVEKKPKKGSESTGPRILKSYIPQNHKKYNNV